MVEEYIAAMRSVQPSGPYTLLGWSSGGTVAHEMAVRLEDEGDTVSAVIPVSYTHLTLPTNREV